MSHTNSMPASSPLLPSYGRHLLAMMAVALASPLIYFDPSPFSAWAVMWLGPVVIAAAIMMVTKFITPSRMAKPGAVGFTKLAWVLLAMFMLAQWMDFINIPAPQKQSAETTYSEPAPAPAKNGFTWEEAQFPAR